MKNRQIVLKSYPKGMPSEEDFDIQKTTVEDIPEDGVLIKTKFISIDPYMRGRMSELHQNNMTFKLDQPIEGGIVGEVVKSNTMMFRKGDIVAGFLPWKEYVVAYGWEVNKVQTRNYPSSYALSALGIAGLSAYFGITEIGKPKEGETLFVTSAAGGVGSMAGQIGKILGCHVVGVCGSDEKVRYVKEELGFDDAFNYKDVEDMEETVKKYCPEGIDVFFDNVGGPIEDAAMKHINKFARIIVCGQISHYNDEKRPQGPRVASQLISKSALMQGFMVRDYRKRFKEGVNQLVEWMAMGQIQYNENIINGFENCPKAFIGMLNGENIGKQVIKVF
ncbi:MAG: NADP-dependent oxidoreductase [Hyphomicrobiales bacterium]